MNADSASRPIATLVQRTSGSREADEANRSGSTLTVSSAGPLQLSAVLGPLVPPSFVAAPSQAGGNRFSDPGSPWLAIAPHRPAALPATVPLDQLHWKLNPPSRPSTSRISPHRNTPLALRDSSVLGFTSSSATPPAVTSAFS